MKISSYGQHLKHFKISASATLISSALSNILSNEMTTEMGTRSSNLVKREAMMDVYMAGEAYKHCQEKSEK